MSDEPYPKPNPPPPAPSPTPPPPIFRRTMVDPEEFDRSPRVTTDDPPDDPPPIRLTTDPRIFRGGWFCFWLLVVLDVLYLIFR